MIRYGTHSDYVHIGIVVKNPEFLDKPLEGVYIWESGYEGTPDPKDGRIKLGVQLTNINDFMNNYTNAKMFVRKFNDYSLFTNESPRSAPNSL